MPSPFPGMDPYLEGHVWPDVHHSLATEIKTYLLPLVVPKYLVRIATYIVTDTSPEEDIGIMYPDVELLQKKHNKLEEEEASYGTKPPPLTPVTVSIPTINPVEVPIPVVEIRDRDNNQLITAIEILSPVNKRKPGLESYVKKRKQLHKDGIHLLEIDLLRRGRRPFEHPAIPQSSYLVTLLRGNDPSADLWTIQLKDVLPVVPVPLKAPDPDIHLDLQNIYTVVYEKSFYGLSINYQQPAPPPPFTVEETDWVKECISRWSMNV